MDRSIIALFCRQAHLFRDRPVLHVRRGGQILAQIADCGARLVLLSGPTQVRKLSDLGEELPAHVRCVAYDAVDERIRGNSVPALADHLADVPDAANHDIEQTATSHCRTLRGGNRRTISVR